MKVDRGMGSPGTQKLLGSKKAPAAPQNDQHQHHADHTKRLEDVFHALGHAKQGYVSSLDLVDQLEQSGLVLEEDTRLKPVYDELKKMNGVRRDVRLSFEEFAHVVGPCGLLISNAVAGQLIIPSFQEFCEEITAICEQVGLNDRGKVADYIPELANADPSQFGVSICTVDGQRFSWGTCDNAFCIQSCSKPISYMAACDAHGSDEVHQYVGREPSGVGFDTLVLKTIDPTSNEREATAVPHNPLVNSGAIMTASLLLQIEGTMSSRYKDMLKTFARLFGGTRAGFDNATYLSEKESAYRNWCLAYMMQEKKSFSENMKRSLSDILEYYFQICSITATNDQMALLAATLANGGMCPTTNDQVFNSEIVRDCLTLMLSCGMYDYSGEWAFNVGLPAKSGVSGCVFIVVPNLMGISIFSPKLDSSGNSVRGVDFATRLLQQYPLHMHDNLKGSTKTAGHIDLRARRNVHSHHDTIELLFAAAVGDIHALQHMEARGVPFEHGDYDKRTPLHVAASEGHLACVKFIVNTLMAKDVPGEGESSSLKHINAKDRWERTPLDDAITGGFSDIITFLQSYADEDSL